MCASIRSFGGLALVLVAGTGLEAQARAPAPVPRDPGAVPAASVEAAARPALVNGREVVRLVRRWYRSLDTRRSLGEGSVLLRLRVEPDGSVSEATAVRGGGHHPALNMLAERAGRRLRFAAADPTPGRGDGPSGGPSATWIHQRIHFRR